MRGIATSLLVCLCALLCTLTVTAQLPPPYDYVSCSSNTLLEITALSSQAGPTNGTTLVTVSILTAQEITNGTFNQSVIGIDANGNAVPGAFSFSVLPLSSVLSLPLYSEVNSYFQVLLDPYTEKGVAEMNFTYRAWDQHQQEIMCFTLVWTGEGAQQQQVEKQVTKKTIAPKTQKRRQAHPRTVSSTQPFTSCSSSSPFTVQSVTIQSTYQGSQPGTTVLETLIVFQNTGEAVTTGTWNLTEIGIMNGGGSSTGHTEYSGELSSFLFLPINQGQNEFEAEFTTMPNAVETNFSVTAYDQNDQQVMCFSFVWGSEKNVNHKKKKNVVEQKNKMVKRSHNNKKKQQRLSSHTASIMASVTDLPPFPFTPCSSDSLLTITGLNAGQQSAGNPNEYYLNMEFEYTASETITGGTYNLSAQTCVGDLPETGQIGSLLSLPITAGSSGSFGAQILLMAEGTNNLTAVAYDQNGEEVMCITFQSGSGQCIWSEPAPAAPVQAVMTTHSAVDANQNQLVYLEVDIDTSAAQ